MQAGNTVVIGAVNDAVATSLTRTRVGRRTVIAECFQMWRTQDHAIDDFPWIAHGRCWPLIQQTYCANGPHVILPIS